jgi:predicted dehydrogenase
MSTPPVRVGVVGRGFGARVVAPVFQETEGCEVVAVVSPRDDAAVRALCARRDVDVVSVHSPPFLHRDHVCRALDAGHAVACDKPFGRDAADAAAMCDAAEAAGAVNVLNFEFRYDPVREALRALVRDGAVGEPQHLQHTMIASLSRTPLRPYGWLFDRERGGGWLGAFGSHVVDFARWTFGEIATASAELRTAIAERPDGDGTPHRCTAEDGFVATLRSASGVTVAIDSTFAAPASLPPRTVVVGAEGVLETEADRRITLHRAGAEPTDATPEASGDDPYLGPMRRWAAAVRDAVRRDGTGAGDGGGVPTFADGLACARVMDEMRG